MRYYTFNLWRADVIKELEQSGYTTNKKGFYSYLEDRTDLLKIKHFIVSNYRSENVYNFCNFTWQELYNIIIA